MSIYHRYALFYSLQHYLADVDKLCDLALEGNVVEDVPDQGPSDVPAQLSTYKYIYEDPILEDEPGLLDDTECIEDDEEYDPNDDKENRYDPSALCEQNHCGGQEADDLHAETDGQNDHYRGFEDCLAADIEDNGTQPGPESTVGDRNLSPDISDHSPENTTFASTNDDTPKFDIKRSQLNRLMACERLLYSLNSGLIRNIQRIEERKNERSSQTIQYFWREAARLQGSDKIKPMRVQERELASNSRWDSESSWREEASTDPSREDGAPFKSTPTWTTRRHSSPLYKTLDPDDLQWEYQVQEWQLGLGRTVDDEGRRFYKM